MTDNLRIWDVLGKTDPKHTKSFKRAGGFSGTAMRPIWMVKRLTEMFGPAGTGWGMDKPEFQTVDAGGEVLVFCTVGLWYAEASGVVQTKHTVYGVGGDKVLGKNKHGPYTNDEAFKASYTDALSNAMKHIGVGADIHMGLFDDEKYVRDMEREFDADIERLAPKNAPRGGDGKLLSSYDANKDARAKQYADSLIESFNMGNRDSAKAVKQEAWNVPAGKKKSPLQWLEDNSVEQFERVRLAYENATGEQF